MTPQWQASYGRRNLVEGAFGNLKNDPAQDITRGRIHVMGRVKTTLMLAFAAMAHNLRIAAIRATRASTPPPSTPPKARTPRLRSRRMQHARLRTTARRLQQATTSPPDQPPDQPPGPPPDEPGTDPSHGTGTMHDNPFIP